MLKYQVKGRPAIHHRLPPGLRYSLLHLKPLAFIPYFTKDQQIYLFRYLDNNKQI